MGLSLILTYSFYSLTPEVSRKQIHFGGMTVDSDLLVKRKDIVVRMIRAGVLVNRDVLKRLDDPVVVEEWHKELARGVSVVELVSPDVWIEVIARKDGLVRKWSWNPTKGKSF